MTVGISHTFGGDVVIVSMDDGKRWDMTPSMAVSAAEQCEELAGRCCHSGMAIMKALDNREFRFAGSHVDLLKMAADLRDHSSAALAARPLPPGSA